MSVNYVKYGGKMFQSMSILDRSMCINHPLPTSVRVSVCLVVWPLPAEIELSLGGTTSSVCGFDIRPSSCWRADKM